VAILRISHLVVARSFSRMEHYSAKVVVRDFYKAV